MLTLWPAGVTRRAIEKLDGWLSRGVRYDSRHGMWSCSDQDSRRATWIGGGDSEPLCNRPEEQEKSAMPIETRQYAGQHTASRSLATAGAIPARSPGRDVTHEEGRTSRHEPHTSSVLTSHLIAVSPSLGAGVNRVRHQVRGAFCFTHEAAGVTAETVNIKTQLTQDAR